MSEIKKKLLEPVITKKQVIWIIVLAGVLVTSFAFSSYFFSLVLGTQRDEPSDELDTAEHEDAKQLTPHYPFDMDDLLDWLEDNMDDLDYSDLEDLEDLGIDISDIDLSDLALLNETIDEEEIAQFIADMMDGDVDDYDLAIAGLAIAALLFSDVEAFRVYEYFNPIEDREDILWKYEAYDEFNRYEWVSTVPMEQTVYPDDPDPLSDVNKIQKPLSVIQGSNSLVLGSRFNELVKPSILDDSIAANNLDQIMYFYDELGCSSVDLDFDQAGDVNMTYNVFGIDLRTNDEINQTAKGIDQNPADPDFQKFLQLPGGVSKYISDNLYFRTDRNNLVGIISGSDNAFMVANKIRNYLQSNFDLTFDALVNDPPGDTEDVVEWFCEHGEGMYSEFASAFVAFARSFGVGARFVDGFNSRLIEEFNDTDNNPYYPIKYKNIYNWAEVFVPWGPGTGRWVQMDILYDSYGSGGQPIQIVEFNLTVNANSSEYKRGQVANITAYLDSSTLSVDGREIIFRDLTTGQNIGSDFTNAMGKASITVNIDNNFIAGPNVIEASYLNVENYTYFVVDEKVGIVLYFVSPQEVNITEDPTIRIRGFLGDWGTSTPIENAEVNFVLFHNGTNNDVPKAFSQMTANTSATGFFDEYIDVQDYVEYGEYEVRVDFNGSWNGFPQFSLINASSNRVYLNVTKKLSYNLYFSIDGRLTEFPADPDPGTLLQFIRTNQINLSVNVRNAEDGTPVSGVLVEFYDFSNGDNPIGFDVSSSSGNASILHTIGNTHKSGPTLVYVKVGNVKNYSYFIVDEPVYFDIISGPNPLEIWTDSPPFQFNVQCNLVDEFDNSIDDTKIAIRMFRGGFEYTNFLTPSNPESPASPGTNYFDIDRDVNPNITPRNYTLRLDFNGTFDFQNHPYPFLFNLGYISNSTILANELKVFDPADIIIKLSVEGNPTTEFYNEFYKPQNYTRGQIARFQVDITQSGGPPLANSNVTIWDAYSGIMLDKYTYPGGKTFVQFNISTNKFYHSGIHQILVRLDNNPTINTTFIIINETVDVIASPYIKTDDIDNVVTRDDGGFIVQGFLWENNTALRGLRVRLLLFNKNNVNVSQYLIGNPFALTDANGNFTIQIDGIALAAPVGEYYIRIDFNGSINIPEIPGINLIMNYMVSSSSSLISLNITATTIITQIDYYSDYEYLDPDSWLNNDILHVIGNLTWDNNTGISGMTVNVTIQLLDGTVIAYNDSVVTDPSGEFHGLLTVDTSWPSSRSETKIVVYFKPELSSLQFAEESELKYS